VDFPREQHAGSVAKFHSSAATEIGRRIRVARQELGISLEDLGELADVNWTTVGKIERGASSPTVESLIRIATALEVDPGVFVSGITADMYGGRPHQVTVRDLINARRDQQRNRRAGG